MIRRLLASSLGDSLEGCLGLLEPQPLNDSGLELSSVKHRSPAGAVPAPCAVDAKSAAQTLGGRRDKKKIGWNEGIEENVRKAKTDKMDKR